VVSTGALSAQTLPPPGRSGQLSTLPLTQLDERAPAADFDSRRLRLTVAQPVPIQDLLLLLVRGTGLSVSAEAGLPGSFMGELKDVTVRQALRQTLPPLGLDYSLDGSLIHVFRREPETRIFRIDYVATERKASSAAGRTPDGNVARVTSETNADVFAEIAKGVQGLISEHATFNVDRQAGLLQATDLPERLDRIADYLDAVHERVHRQLQIDVRVLQVELNDTEAQSIDLAALVPGAGRPGSAAGSRLLLAGLNAGDVPRFLAALASVGKVTTLADPHVLALNNETAVVRGSQGAQGSQGSPGSQDISLAVTPQIEDDGVIMLSLSHIVDLKIASADRTAYAAVATEEADTVARMLNGETLIVSGFPTMKRVALLVLLTPSIVNPVGAP
jgi:type II secretory pathway component HofQ